VPGLGSDLARFGRIQVSVRAWRMGHDPATMPAADATGAIAPDLLVAVRAAGEWGVLSPIELRACGLSAKGIAVRARQGRLHRIHRGVYAVGHAGVPLEGRFLAAVKACGPGAVLSHYSAAALWGLVDWDDRRIQVIVTSPPCSRLGF
jgi:Transcriptional regulator, AbiEi antitoxin